MEFVFESIDDCQFVIWQVISDRLAKGDDLAIVNGSDIDAATLKFVDECLVVIGSHRGPATALHLGVENGSCSGKRQSRVLTRESACLRTEAQT